MKNILSIIKLLVVILLPIYLWASVDNEVIVLFKSDVLKMPTGKDIVSLNEIVAPRSIINCMRVIGTEKIAKAILNFNRADTLRISKDGWVARLPDWSNLYVIDVRIDRDSAIAKLEALSEVIYAEKNLKGEPLSVTPNDTWFHKQWSLNDSTGNIGIDVMRAWDLSKGSSSIIIGVIDAGVRTSGPEGHLGQTWKLESILLIVRFMCLSFFSIRFIVSPALLTAG